MVRAMARGRSAGTRRAAAGISVISLLALAACSGGTDTTTPDSNRACAVVQASELSKITGTRLTLRPAGNLPGVCRFRSGKSATAVDLAVTHPVEADSLSLLLDLPTRERGIGDEAWSSTTNTSQAIRLLARRRGAMLSIDLSIEGGPKNRQRAAAREVAKVGVANLPKVPVAKATGLRGTDACKAFASAEVADLLGGKPEVSATQPLGSCLLTVPDKGLNVTVSTLAENADEQTLKSVVASAPSPVLTDANGMPAFWIPIPKNAAAGGQLDLLDGSTLRQISVIGSGFKSDEAQQLAVDLAKLAF